MRAGNWSGVTGINPQDLTVAEGMGPIVDRSREHLGASDLGVIATRRMLLKQLEALQNGQEPSQPHTPRVYHLRSLALNAPRERAWQDLMREHMRLEAPAQT